MHRLRPASLLIVTGTLVLAAAGVSAQDRGDAAERLRTTMRAAAEQGPGRAVTEATLDAVRAGFVAGTGAGAPSIELQREGFDGLFHDSLISIWYLRTIVPFNAPWQSSNHAPLDESVTRWRASEGRARALERAERVAGRWLELAAERERLVLLAARVARMDRALVIQQRRFDVGEVSGSDVTQLRLERLIDLAQLRQAEARAVALASAIRSLTGTDFPEPHNGDLAALIATSGELPDDNDVATAVADTVAMRAARDRADAERRWGDLLQASVHGRPSLSLEYERVPELQGAPAINAWGFMISVPLPLGRARSARVEESRSAARLLDAEARRTQLQLERALREASASATAAAGVLAEFAPSIARAVEIERSLADQFRLGAISYLVYIDGLTRLDEVLLQATASRLALLSSRLRAAAILDDPSIFPLPARAPSESTP